jgi:hypothetical protein
LNAGFFLTTLRKISLGAGCISGIIGAVFN